MFFSKQHQEICFSADLTFIIFYTGVIYTAMVRNLSDGMSNFKMVKKGSIFTNAKGFLGIFKYLCFFISGYQRSLWSANANSQQMLATASV